MSDLIDRQALCDDLREYKVYPVPILSDESEVKGYNDGIDLAISVISEFPSVEPERKKGKWIVTSEFKDCRYVKCNQCKVTQVFYYNKPLTNFCPNCGAEMRGE